MMKRASLALLVLVLALAACGRKEALPPLPASAPPAQAQSEAAPARAMAAEEQSKPADGTARRYVAYRHFLKLELPREAVPAALQGAQAQCEKLAAECQVVSAVLSRPTSDAAPRGSLQIRIAPARVAAYRQNAVGRAEVIEDRSEAEDKTGEVIDIEARQQNKAALRDRLRKLMDLPGAKVKDLIELESQLATVQSELDALAGKRKALANETEKVFMSFEFLPRAELGQPGSFSVLGNAFGDLGHTFASSLAALITFLAVVIPWLLVLWIPFWLIRRGWRRWRQRRQGATISN